MRLNGRKEKPMLSKTLPAFLYAEDSTLGTPTDTQPIKTGQDVTEKLFTQEDLNKHIGSAKKDAKNAAISALLDELGFDSPDSLKALVKAQKEKAESEKSEAQKLADKLVEMQKLLDAEKLARTQAEQSRLLEKRDAALRALLVQAHDPEGALILIKAKHAAKVESLLSETGEVDSKEAEKLVSEYRAANGYQFKDSKGSPSNAEGRLLKPNGEVKDEVRKEIKRKFNF
jgi:hypothetical protein